MLHRCKVTRIRQNNYSIAGDVDVLLHTQVGVIRVHVRACVCVIFTFSKQFLWPGTEP